MRARLLALLLGLAFLLTAACANNDKNGRYSLQSKRTDVSSSEEEGVENSSGTDSNLDLDQENAVTKDTSSLLYGNIPEIRAQDIPPEQEIEMAKTQDMGFQEADVGRTGGEDIESLSSRSFGRSSEHTSTPDNDEDEDVDDELKELDNSGDDFEDEKYKSGFRNQSLDEDSESQTSDGTGVAEDRQYIGSPEHIGPPVPPVMKVFSGEPEHVRLPRPYPGMIHVHVPNYHVVPRLVAIPHYKPIPFPVRYNRLQGVDSPYYMPFKTGPDVTETHVDVYQPISPCKNGGILITNQGGLNCLCPRDFIGKFCDDKLYCASSPCENGGTCDEISNNYRCRCPRGHKGYNCEDRDECALNPCKNDGTCVETISGHECVCRHGFTGDVCQFLDYCDPNPCRHGGICEQSQQAGHHQCQCPPHFKGSLCETRRQCFANPCRNGGKCVEDGHRYPCVCPAGYKPPYCREHVCAANPCLNGGKCVPQRAGFTWSYKCVCSLLYRGDNCEVPNPCVTRPCLNGGSCIDSYSDYTGFPADWNAAHLHYMCICPPGYSGPKCEDFVCLHCDSNATCIGGRCICNSGYYGDGNHCYPHKSPCIPSPCQNNGTCTVGPDGSFDCHCPPGYEPPLCIKKEACVPNPCKHGGICVPELVIHPGHLYVRAHFKCVCPPGFLPPDCNNATEDACQPNPCLNGAKCIKSSTAPSGYICNCPPDSKFNKPPKCECNCPAGDLTANPPILPSKCDATGNNCYCPKILGKTYVLVEKGCAEQRTSACDPNPCEHGGTCTNVAGGYRCECPPPCTGERCQFCQVCKNESCLNGGTCIPVGLKAFCKCPPGFAPPKCTPVAPTTPVNHYCHPNPCQNGGKCNERADGYDCDCVPPFMGPHCEKDKCMDCDINANCIVGTCKCRKGYRGSGYKGDCAKVESKCYMCPLNAMCVDGNCACTNGYQLQSHKCIKIG